MSDTYAVYGTDVDRDYLLGYARGNPKDIKIVFEHKKGYGLKLTAVRALEVTPELAQSISRLRTEKAVYEAKLKEVESKLKELRS